MTDTETKTNQDDLAKAMLDGLKELIKTTAKDNTDSKFSYEQREELSDMIYERVEEQIETQLDDMVNDKVIEWLDSNLAERLNDRITITFD